MVSARSRLKFRTDVGRFIIGKVILQLLAIKIQYSFCRLSSLNFESAASPVQHIMNPERVQLREALYVVRCLRRPR
jgi:hypothetical protein